MRIIKDTPEIKFNNWEEIYKKIRDEKIENPDIDSNTLLKNVKELESVSQDTFFSKPQIVSISNLINQFHHFKPGINHSFISDINLISRMIKFLKKHPKSQNLFNKHIFSNLGFYSQFLVSAWINKYLQVVDFELNNPPYMTDILVKLLNNHIHIHIKDITEQEREDRLNEAIIYFEHEFKSKARSENKDEFLAIKSFRGVPPSKVNPDYWINLAKNTKEVPQTIKITFDPNDGYGNSEPVEIKIELFWRELSGTFPDPAGSFNNAMRLESEYEKINKTISIDTDAHVLIAITDDKYYVKDLRELVKGKKLGILVLEVFDFNFFRSKFILPRKRELENELNSKIPARVVFE